VEVTDVTLIQRALRRRGGPPSLRAQVVLLTSAFLLGGVLAGLLFVGVWRHTAAEGDDARAAQLEASQRLRVTEQKLADLARDLAAARAGAARTGAALRASQQRAAALQRQATRAGAALDAPLGDVAANANALAARTKKLRSALTTISAYLGSSSAGGIDPAFLDAQIAYVADSAAVAERTAASVAGGAAQAQHAAAQLRRKP
jgi:hypothetical protein